MGLGQGLCCSLAHERATRVHTTPKHLGRHPQLHRAGTFTLHPSIKPSQWGGWEETVRRMQVRSHKLSSKWFWSEFGFLLRLTVCNHLVWSLLPLEDYPPGCQCCVSSPDPALVLVLQQNLWIKGEVAVTCVPSSNCSFP